MRNEFVADLDAPSGRLGGGPKLAPEDHLWWVKEGERVAAHEGQKKMPFTALLTRIARFDLDLTDSGLRLYQKMLAKHKKRTITRNGSPPKK